MAVLISCSARTVWLTGERMEKEAAISKHLQANLKRIVGRIRSKKQSSRRLSGTSVHSGKFHVFFIFLKLDLSQKCNLIPICSCRHSYVHSITSGYTVTVTVVSNHRQSLFIKYS